MGKKILPLLGGAWAAVRDIPDPASLGADQTFTLTDRAVEILYDFKGPPTDGLALGLARYDDVAKQWFPALAVITETLDPMLQVGRGSVRMTTFEGLRAGVYGVLVLAGPPPEAGLQLWANPYSAGSGSGAGGGAGGAALFETFTALDGRNVAGSPDAIVKSWDGTQTTYAGPIAKLPRPTTAVVAASADYDGGDVVLTGARFGNPVTETITPNPGNFTEGKIVFDAITAQSRSKTGTKGTTSLGFGNTLGLSNPVKGGVVAWIDDAMAAAADFKLDTAQAALIPTAGKVPDGKRSYRILY